MGHKTVGCRLWLHFVGSGLHVVGLREDASSFNKVVSLEASSAVTVFGVFSALVRDGNAYSVSIEDPSS